MPFNLIEFFKIIHVVFLLLWCLVLAPGIRYGREARLLFLVFFALCVK